jgi:GTP-binding protein HflX
VIGPYPRDRRAGVRARSASLDRSSAARLDEAVGLARAIELDVVEAGVALLNEIHPATFIGKGKVDEFAGVVKSLDAGLVVMDCALFSAAAQFGKGLARQGARPHRSHS